MSEFCIHFANILYLVSFLSRDILVLRILTCLGLAFGVIFFTTCPTPMYGPTIWHVVFLVINFVQIYRLFRERRETDLPDEQEDVADIAFEDLSRDELVNILTLELSGRLDKRRNFKMSSQQEMNEQELILRRMVLDKLSRRELENLLARRMWKPVERRFNRIQKDRVSAGHTPVNSASKEKCKPLRNTSAAVGENLSDHLSLESPRG